MSKLLELYLPLLETYSEQVKNLEDFKSEKEKEHKTKISWVPHSFINSRIFTPDEYLNNLYHGGSGFEEKNNILPLLLPFMAAYEKTSDKEKEEFEESKPKNNYQSNLEEVWKGKGSMVNFFQGQHRELVTKESYIRLPKPPSRSNATRQLAKYEEEQKEYYKKAESIERCKREILGRLDFYKSLLSSN